MLKIVELRRIGGKIKDLPSNDFNKSAVYYLLKKRLNKYKKYSKVNLWLDKGYLKFGKYSNKMMAFRFGENKLYPVRLASQEFDSDLSDGIFYHLNLILDRNIPDSGFTLNR